MSQNKTVIQGLEPAEAPTQNMSAGASSNLYARGTQPLGGPARGTVVPGMMTMGQQAPETPSAQQPVMQGRAILSGKPVVGFLYSISRTAAGEYWPLHVGPNTIGQNASCDVVLPEGTVSGEHAVIVVRKMKNPEKVIASISDARSTNGTMLNGESLGFAAEECKNGDVITVGDNYELLLVLIDAAGMGLKVSEKFIPVSVEEEEAPVEPASNNFPPGMTRPGDTYPSYGGPIPPSFGGYTPAGGTVGLDGTAGMAGKGGTVGM